MKKLRVFDDTKNETVELDVEEHQYNQIVLDGDMDLALTLVRRHEERQNYLAAYNIMRSCTESRSTALSDAGKNLSIESSETCFSENEQFEEQGTTVSEKMWTSERTLFLISLVKKYDKDFESTLKKTLWKKIADEITKKTKIVITSQQCDTKWKALKNQYKNIKKHNSTSGNNPKFWIFFDAVDEILNLKPEINPIAVCSNRDGLITNEFAENSETDSSRTSKRPGPRSPISNLLKRQRKSENTTERRHKEKLERQDRFLNIFERMTTALENMSQQRHDTV